MHELGVVFQVIRIVEETAEENHLEQIETVTLELGEVSTVLEEYLLSCWKWAVAKQPPMLQNARLVVEKIPAVTWCDSCKKTYETVLYGKQCPYCKSTETWLLSGNEFRVKEIGGC